MLSSCSPRITELSRLKHQIPPEQLYLRSSAGTKRLPKASSLGAISCKSLPPSILKHPPMLQIRPRDAYDETTYDSTSSPPSAAYALQR